MADPLTPEDDDGDDRQFGPWCDDIEGHRLSHGFCIDHQSAWCKKCEGGCPECFRDPHCPECHASLNEEEHDWDCGHAD